MLTGTGIQSSQQMEFENQQIQQRHLLAKEHSKMVLQLQREQTQKQLAAELKMNYKEFKTSLKHQEKEANNQRVPSNTIELLIIFYRKNLRDRFPKQISARKKRRKRAKIL